MKVSGKRIKLPNRFITHTIQDTVVSIDKIPEDITEKNDELVISECCRFIGCQFIIDTNTDVTLYFDECIFIDCKFKNNSNANITIDFTACDFDKAVFQSGKFDSLAFNNCTIYDLKTTTRGYVTINNITFYRCYQVSNIHLRYAKVNSYNFLQNISYDNVDLIDTLEAKSIVFEDKHLLKYWREKFFYSEAKSEMNYLRITTDTNKKK